MFFARVLAHAAGEDRQQRGELLELRDDLRQRVEDRVRAGLDQLLRGRRRLEDHVEEPLLSCGEVVALAHVLRQRGVVLLQGLLLGPDRVGVVLVGFLLGA